MLKFSDRNLVKVIWAFSAVLAVALGLLLPSPAVFGLHNDRLIHVGSPRG